MSMVRRGLASQVAAARGVDFRASRAGWGAALSFVVLSLALAGGDALSQISGCGRCSSAPVASGAAAPQNAMEPRRTRRVALRSERPRRGAVGGSYLGGSYFVCVRGCDGSFFPVSYSGGNPSDLQEVCQSLCPDATVALYSFPFGGVIDEAVSASGEPYANLPNAQKFEHTFDASCSCRAPGQSWADALAAAELKYGHHPHDVLVTEEQSNRLSRADQDPSVKPAVPDSATDSALAGPAASVEPAASLDMNDVDTGLRAASAAMSRATSGIKYDEGASGPHYGLHQGQTVAEMGPDGGTRRVRILPSSF